MFDTKNKIYDLLNNNIIKIKINKHFKKLSIMLNLL